MQSYNLVSLSGIPVLLFIAWLLSSDKRHLNWRLIGWGLALQFTFAAFIFLFPPGVKVFVWLNDIVVAVMDSATAGSKFVFGRLALPPGTVDESGAESLGFFLAFQGLSSIVFFSALIAILYYVGIMPWLVRSFARIFTKLMKISGAESLCVSSNIFVGVESSLTVKPHLENMTRSELMTVLTAGMATVSSNVLAVYVFSLREHFPTIAAHLISASLLSAPAALIMSKIILPESDTPKTLGINIKPFYKKDRNIIEAIINGANDAVRLIVGIVALLIAFLGLLALVNLVLGGIGGKINELAGIGIDWSLEGLLSYIFYPVALVIGIPPADAGEVAKLIGGRMIVTELSAYQTLAQFLADGALQHGRSAVISAYALCGFAHVASVAIFVGGISAIAPKSVHTLSKIGMRALVAATLACLMTACIAGAFYNEGSILFGM